MHWYTTTISAVLCASVLVPGSGRLFAAEKAAAKTTYDDHVRPIFRQKCFACHNPDKRSGDLDLTNYTNLMQGGASGEVVEPGDASSSYLYMLVTHEDEPAMPPSSPKLADDLLATIGKWIDAGALENAGSKARGPQRPKLDLTIATGPDQRPEEVPMPARMSLEPVIHTQRANAVTALAANPYAPLAAAAGQQQVLLYHTGSLQLLGVLAFPEGTLHTLTFSRNGSLLLAGGGQEGASGKVVVWDVKTAERMIQVGDELDVVLTADISADQSLIALGGPGRVVRVYVTATDQVQYEVRTHTDWITAVAFSPDGVLLATGDRSGNLLVWEAATGRDYATLKGHKAAITGLGWRGDSNVLSSSSEDGTVRLWEMEAGRQIKSINAHSGGAQAVTIARDGRILSCGRDRTAKLWDPSGKLLRALPKLADVALRVAFCNETDRAIVGDWTGAIHLYAAKDGQPAGQWTANPSTLDDRLRVAKAQLAAKQSAAIAAQQAADSQVKQFAERLAAAKKKATAAKRQAAVASQAVAAAEAEVKHWTDEIAFDHQLRQLGAQRAAALQELAARETDAARLRHVAEEAAKQAAAAREAAADGAKAVAAAERLIEEIQQKLVTLRSVATPQKP